MHRIFSRIREHEKLCDAGKSPAEEAWKRQFGEDFVESDPLENDENVDDDFDPENIQGLGLEENHGKCIVDIRLIFHLMVFDSRDGRRGVCHA